MIDLRPAKAVQGRVELPVSPDLLFMAALGACAAAKKVSIQGVSGSDVINDIVRALSGHAAVVLSDSVMEITPQTESGDPAILLTLPESLLPYRVIYLFMGLGMGKTVLLRSAPQRQLQDLIAQAKRIGIAVEMVDVDQSAGLRLSSFDSGAAEGAYPNEDDCAALLAFLFGKGEKLTFAITDYHLSTPLRQLAGVFGFVLNPKQTTASDDPLAKRMRFLKGKQAKQQAPSQISYTVETDFSRRDETRSESALNLTIPGDDVFAAAFITLKCLIHKGDLEVSNVPLESWAIQGIFALRKMGCKITAKDSGKTSFGSRGIVTVQKSDFFGRKIRCIPLYQYISQLPAITVAAAFAGGKSVFRDLDALRLFEPDGLDQFEKSLRPLGVRHGEMPDGIVVEGAREFDGFDILEPLPAHIAAAFCMAGLKCVGKTSIADDFIYARWPEFEKTINEICEFRGAQKT